MRNWLKKDLKIKIGAVLIAILFWLYVFNVSNPFQTTTILNVPLKIENENYLEENGYTVKNTYRSGIDVTIRGRKETVEKIKPGDFEASLDFSQIQSVSDKKLLLPEPVCTQKDVRIISYSPTAIDLQLARNKSGTFAVELKSSVTMKPGYILLNTIVSPETMRFVAEESIIDSVGSIKANLEIKDLDRDMTKQVQYKVYNKEGKEINSLSNSEKVSVKLEVAKEVPISLVTRGRLSADHVETLRVINPATVLITGPVEALQEISSIKTEQIDIDKIDGNFTWSVPLVVPEGVKLNNTPKEIAVNISIEKLVIKDFDLVKNDISILNAINNGSLQYDIKTDKLLLQFKGRQADVDTVKLENLKPAVDVAGLLEGTHKLPLSISIPSQVKLMQMGIVDVKVTKTQETSVTQGTTSP